MEENRDSAPSTPATSPVNPTTTPEAAPQNPMQPSSKFKFSAKAIISVILLLLLAGGAAACVTVFKPQILKVISKPSSTVAPRSILDPSPIPKSISITDWETYTNTEYYYSIKHPADWNIRVKGDADPTKFVAPYLESPCNYNSGQLCSQILISVSTPTSKEDLKPEWIAESSDKIDNQKSTTVDGQKASEFDFFQTNYGVNHEGRTQHVVISQNNNLKYTFTYEEFQKGKDIKTPKDWKSKELFDQILATFKFTDQPPTPTPKYTGWQKCGGNQFSFLYPRVIGYDPPYDCPEIESQDSSYTDPFEFKKSPYVEQYNKDYGKCNETEKTIKSVTVDGTIVQIRTCAWNAAELELTVILFEKNNKHYRIFMKNYGLALNVVDTFKFTN